MTRKQTLGLVAAGVLTIVSIPTFAVAQENFKDVLIRNGVDRPVPTQAQGTTNVGGTVNVGNLPATQQVGGAVEVTNLPATQQVGGAVEVTNLPAAARTVKLADVTLGAADPNIVLDVAAYEAVRIVTRSNITLCTRTDGAEILVTAPYEIDRFTAPRGRDATSLIEVPGTSMRVINAHATDCPTFVEVYGRP